MAIDLLHVHATKPGRARLRVRGTGSRYERDELESVLQFRGEDIDMNSILNPPRLFPLDVSTCGRSEAYEAGRQRERSSFRISTASTRLPAATSASDWRKASWRAARSASSSQSPGSSGNNSTSVPSGKSVGSSTSRRPPRTRALMVMRRGYHGTAAQHAMEPTAPARARRGSSLDVGRTFEPLLGVSRNRRRIHDHERI
jgi:hypothetical protein